MLAVTLGNIKVETLPRKEFIAKDVANKMDIESIEYLMMYSYDNFELHLTDLQVLFRILLIAILFQNIYSFLIHFLIIDIGILYPYKVQRTIVR